MRNGSVKEKRPVVIRIPFDRRKPLTYRITIRQGYTFSDNGPVPNLFKRLVLAIVMGWVVEVYPQKTNPE